MSIQRRSLLARIEGQLARLVRASGSPGLPQVAALHWQRIEWACRALRPLLATPEEQARFQRLLAELKVLNGLAGDNGEFLHRATLLRADCVIWQLSLVQERRQRDFISRASEPFVNETAR